MKTKYALNSPATCALRVIVLAGAIGTVALQGQEPAAAPPPVLPPPDSAPAPAPVPVPPPGGPSASNPARESLPPSATPAEPASVPGAGGPVPGSPPAPLKGPTVLPLAPGAPPLGLTPGAPKPKKNYMLLPGRSPARTSTVAPSAIAGLPKANMGVGVAGTSLDLDLNADPQAAAQQYRDYISAYDAQREAAAHAVFGLGEAYRKLGRLDEARAQYGRILREFVDFPELARQSQKLLSENQPGRAPAANSTRSAGSSEAIEEERKLVQEELDLLQDELKNIHNRISTGVDSTASALPIQRDILQLKQRLVRLRNEEGKTPSPAR